MKAIIPTKKCPGIPVITDLTFMLTIIGLLLCAPVSSAQQEPNRQLVQTNAQPAGNVRRIALVIGNGAYTNAPGLKNPPNDARDMAANLASLGFEVARGVNVNQREMKRLIREFGQKLKAGGHGLFYYAGHGVQARGRNFIIPVDAEILSEADVEDSGVDVGLVLNYMDDAQNGLNIVILDACRNNPFARSFRSASDGLAQVDAPTGTLIAYATAPGKVAADGAGENGLYTSELLKAMKLPGLSATDMFMQVRAEVMKRTGNKQVPWEASSLIGTFYFGGGGPTARSDETGTPTSAPKFDAAAFEYNYWDTIKNSHSADDFKAYLSRYPKGQFVELATNRIKALEVVAKPVEPEPVSRDTGGATEIAFWDSVKGSTNPEDYRAYLKRYPEGAFAELAKNRLAPLEVALKEKEKEEEARKAAAALVTALKTYDVEIGYKNVLVEQYSPTKLVMFMKSFKFGDRELIKAEAAKSVDPKAYEQNLF
ncbi:MAG TPA: caspase family protein, partial [Pyrinomonadaceae bacterium]|nr:caspase family protein [Pyrinomonadaceae bacterium]